MTLSRRNRKVGHAFDSNLVPDGCQVMTLVDLNFIRDHPRTECFVVGVLQIPSSLGFLHESSNRLFLDTFGQSLLVDDQPHLEILDSVAVFVLAGSLPGDDVSTQG